jgi:hypothetical protein
MFEYGISFSQDRTLSLTRFVGIYPHPEAVQLLFWVESKIYRESIALTLLNSANKTGCLKVNGSTKSQGQISSNMDLHLLSSRMDFYYSSYIT